MKEPHYHINLFWSDEDGLWIADVPDLRGCMTHGHSRAEAIKNAAQAIEGWLETARDHGFDIPKPRYRPAIYAARDAA
ncbi:MAG TPA: type II toxin-antitoxin system HicB family antitoxin [Sphingomicrobium sp.]|nr:type II toxin-antitoxin system HicB family antitoxin [Sphingomicrobium sp.]